METIRLSNGEWETFITAKRGPWRFYFCRTFEKAELLKQTLTDLGNNCVIEHNRRCYYVMVKN